MPSVLWNTQELEKALQQKISFPFEATGVSIDSRTLTRGDVFIAIKGEQMDGHAFVEDAFNKGAVAAIVSNNIDNQYSIKVPDTLQALHNMATYQRSHIKAKYAGITGSVGKTSIKEMLAGCLNSMGKTFTTQGNFNNHIGLPLCLSRMPKNSEFGVFEMGMNHAGEITPLTKLVQPDVAIISMIAAVHLEFFKSLQDIADAKSEIFAGVSSKGTAVLNADDQFFDYLSGIAKQKYGIKNILGFGESLQANARLISCRTEKEESYIKAEILGQKIEYHLGLPGKHQALNSVAVLAMVGALGQNINSAANALSLFKGATGRGNRYRLLYHDKTIELIDDSYNASPVSVAAALQVLATAKGRKIAVLGDMFELGDDAPLFHLQLKEHIMTNQIEGVFLVGELMKHLYDSLPKTVYAVYANNNEALFTALKDYLKNGDTILVKGSHGMKMIKIVNSLVDCSQKL